MSQRRGTTTNQLRSVLQVLQMGHKTGILYVERESEKGIEAGRMVLAEGNITGAQLGTLQGQSALNVLNTWGICRFLFSSEQAERTTRPLKALPAANSGFGVGVKGEEQGLQRVAGGSGPQRLQQVEEALRRLERAGLSRTHRRLLLLLDGQRQLPELARLMNRREDEVWQLLRDLAERGIIQRI